MTHHEVHGTHIDAPMSVKGFRVIIWGGGDWHFWVLPMGPGLVFRAWLLGADKTGMGDSGTERRLL
jgi:hypothetical protein